MQSNKKLASNRKEQEEEEMRLAGQQVDTVERRMGSLE